MSSFSYAKPPPPYSGDPMPSAPPPPTPPPPAQASVASAPPPPPPQAPPFAIDDILEGVRLTGRGARIEEAVQLMVERCGADRPLKTELYQRLRWCVQALYRTTEAVFNDSAFYSAVTNKLTQMNIEPGIIISLVPSDNLTANLRVIISSFGQGTLSPSDFKSRVFDLRSHYRGTSRSEEYLFCRAFAEAWKVSGMISDSMNIVFRPDQTTDEVMNTLMLQRDMSNLMNTYICSPHSVIAFQAMAAGLRELRSNCHMMIISPPVFDKLLSATAKERGLIPPSVDTSPKVARFCWQSEANEFENTLKAIYKQFRPRRSVDPISLEKL